MSMLQAFAVYLLKVMMVSGILVSYYWLALRNKKFHYYNRFYLLISVALSVLLPLVKLNWFVWHSNNDKAIALLNVVTITGDEDNIVVKGATGFAWQTLAAAAFICIALLMLAVFLTGIVKIYRLKKKYPVTTIESSFDFVNTNLQEAPFSFFKNLFWRNDLQIESAPGQQILQHELVHIRQQHSWDKVFMQLVLVVFWINPFYWLIRKELYLVHEFIADEKAVGDNDTASFAAMLLATQYPLHVFAPAQSFFYSPIKRRLFMLTNSKKTSHNYLQRLLVLPLLAAVTMLFAFKLQKKDAVASVTAEAASSFTVVIDAGHGGKDYGAYGLNNVYEKDIVLEIAKKVKELSSSYNVNVVLTRDKDVYMSPQEKATAANAANANAFVSLHANSKNNDEKNTSGFEIYISDRNTQYDKSKELGSALTQSLEKDFSIYKPLVQRKKGIWVLSATQMPAVLIECGFLTDEKDMSIMTDANKQELMAKQILEGIAAYANNASKEQASNNNDNQNELAMNAGDSTTPDPLYIVDGKETPAKEAKAIKPETIESIYVLKDFDATRKYGDKAKNGVVEIVTKKKYDGNVTTDPVQFEAKFPGGREYWLQYLQHNLKSDIVTKNNAPGGTYTVVVTFLVDKEGNISEVKALNDPGYGTAEEAVRVIREGPKWIPAVKSGRNIIYRQKQTITFAQTDESSSSFTPAKYPTGPGRWVIAIYDHKHYKDYSKLPNGKYTVTVSFMVDENGDVQNVKAKNYPGYGFAANAEKMVQNGRKWIPATRDGVNINSYEQRTIIYHMD